MNKILEYPPPVPMPLSYMDLVLKSTFFYSPESEILLPAFKTSYKETNFSREHHRRMHEFMTLRCKDKVRKVRGNSNNPFFFYLSNFVLFGNSPQEYIFLPTFGSIVVGSFESWRL